MEVYLLKCETGREYFLTSITVNMFVQQEVEGVELPGSEVDQLLIFQDPAELSDLLSS